MSNEEQIKELKKDIQILNGQIGPLEEARSKLAQRILELKSPFKIGDEIWWNAGHQGEVRKGRVIKILEWCCGNPMWRVQRIRKDGSEGEVCEVRDYMKPVAAPLRERG